MKHPYSNEFSEPPALIVPVRLKLQHSASAIPYRAKLDTAADLCAVPREFTVLVRAPMFNARRVRQTGRTELSFLIDIELEGRSYGVEAIAHDRPYVLVGRDILNQLILVADGPGEWFELIEP